MQFLSFVSLALAAAPILVSAAPARFYGKRGASAADITVLKFAHTLECLENTFYQEAMAKFTADDFTSAGYPDANAPLQQIATIQGDEQAHATGLAAILKDFGETAPTCSFNFDSVLTDVTTMAAVARVLEIVGVGAYLGGAAIVDDRSLLVTAGQILTVEARHNTILNVMNKGSAIPAAFDLALSPSEVLALASPFITGACDLGIPANPTLSVTNTGVVGTGSVLSFSSPALNGTVPEDSLFCQMMTGDSPFAIPLPFSNCQVPEGISGPVLIYITKDNQPLNNVLRDRQTLTTIAGPTYAYIDPTPSEALSQAVFGSAGGSTGTISTPVDVPASGDGSSTSSDGSPTPTDAASDSTTTSTQTISPAEASSLISSAGAATGTAGSDAPLPTGTDLSSTPVSSDNSASAGGPNMFTGPSADGKIIVDGWKNVPAPSSK